MQRPRVLLALATCSALVAGGIASASSTISTALAPALGSAVRGGPVIVLLKGDHSSLNLRTQTAQRIAAARADQRPVLADITAHGGTDVIQLVGVNGIAATLSAAEVRHLRASALVKQIVPDPTITVGDKKSSAPTVSSALVAKAASNPFTTKNGCGTKAKPLIEPEAIATIKAPAMTNKGLSTEPGYGVVVANAGLNNPALGDVVGNPNFVRPTADGGGSIIANAIPGDTTDSTDGEYYGDASSIAAQGTVEYQYAKELPYSHLPSTCYFKLVGDAPGVTLVDTDDLVTPTGQSVAAKPDTLSAAQALAGIDTAVEVKADVINESYGFSNTPGMYSTFYAADDVAVAAGTTVVVSSGDSGDSGTVSSPATDPNVIAAGATNTLRENAMAYGYTGWVNNDITPLSSGGDSPNNKLVDLVAPGYGGEAACNPQGSDCPTNTQTEAFGGTSQAAPLIAGGAADVIQAYKAYHGGTAPTPAEVKEILTSTATDIDAPADQQGAGLLNITAAVAAAAHSPGSTAPGGTPALLTSPTQLDIEAAAGTSKQTVTLFNAAATPTTVTGSYRELGAATQLGKTVTEHVTAPAASAAIPSDGATAAPAIHFTVPKGLARLDADLIWPDATNGTILSYILTDPQGRLRNISYDYGDVGSGSNIGSVPNIGHTEVANPEAGTWTATIKWGNGRSHLQELPNTPGKYRGTVSFRVAGAHWITTLATKRGIVLPASGTITVPLSIVMPKAPGDHPESVQLLAANGSRTSLPVARRTLIPSTGGYFNTVLASTVGRGVGAVVTQVVTVPSGTKALFLSFQTPDLSKDDPISVYVVDPSGNATSYDFGTLAIKGKNVSGVNVKVSGPSTGRYEIDLLLNLTTSGKEFSQLVRAHAALTS